jgi:phage terminase small subunit
LHARFKLFGEYTMPRPKKPNALKVLSGSRRIDKHPSIAMPLVDEVPPPPAWLPNEYAAQEFSRLAKILKANGLLNEANASPLAVLASIFGCIVGAHERGEVPTAALIAQYRAGCGEFGLTPATESRIPAPSTPKAENPFARFRR